MSPANDANTCISHVLERKRLAILTNQIRPFPLYKDQLTTNYYVGQNVVVLGNYNIYSWVIGSNKHRDHRLSIRFLRRIVL